MRRRIVDAVRTRFDQLLQFGLVGASGFILDIVLVTGLSAHGLDWLTVSISGWIAAVSWNFHWNWLFTFGQPPGYLRRYGLYVSLNSVAFLGRVGAVALLVATVGILRATILGIGIQSTIWYLACEQVVFDENYGRSVIS